MSQLPPASPPPDNSQLSYHGTPPNPDADHLKILSICFYVLAGLQALIGCGAGGMEFFVGAMIFAGGASGGRDGAAAGAGVAMFPICFGVFFVLLLGTFAFLNYKVGQSLVKRKNRTLCFVIACLVCLSFPIGTALGVFTLIVLSRPSVKASFTS